MLAAGCNTSGCFDNRSSIPLAGLYSAATEEPISLRIIQVHGVGAPGDSLLVAAGTSVDRLYLPMRSTADEVTWCIHYTQEDVSDPAFNDTISFRYSSEPYFASEECGAMYRYRILAAHTTTHLIDSMAIVDSLITNVDIERIKIFFRASDAPTEE